MGQRAEYVDSFLKDSFVKHLIGKEYMAEVNTLWEERLLDVKSPKKRVRYTLEWALSTGQNELAHKFKLKEIAALPYHSSEKEQIVELLVLLRKQHFAYALARKWSLASLLPALSLLSEDEKSYRDSFAGQDLYIDSLYKSYRKKRPKAAIAYSLALVPGAGKIYLGRGFDAWGALLLVGTLSLQASEHEKGTPLLYAYGTAASLFYLGSIYGTKVQLNATRKEHKQKLDEAITEYLFSS